MLKIFKNKYFILNIAAITVVIVVIMMFISVRYSNKEIQFDNSILKSELSNQIFEIQKQISKLPKENQRIENIIVELQLKSDSIKKSISTIENIETIDISVMKDVDSLKQIIFANSLDQILQK